MRENHVGHETESTDEATETVRARCREKQDRLRREDDVRRDAKEICDRFKMMRQDLEFLGHLLQQSYKKVRFYNYPVI